MTLNKPIHFDTDWYPRRNRRRWIYFTSLRWLIWRDEQSGSGGLYQDGNGEPRRCEWRLRFYVSALNPPQSYSSAFLFVVVLFIGLDTFPMFQAQRTAESLTRTATVDLSSRDNVSVLVVFLRDLWWRLKWLPLITTSLCWLSLITTSLYCELYEKPDAQVAFARFWYRRWLPRG